MSMEDNAFQPSAGEGPVRLVVHKTSAVMAQIGGALTVLLSVGLVIIFIRLLIEVFGAKDYLSTFVEPDPGAPSGFKLIIDPLMYYLTILFVLIHIVVAGLGVALGGLSLTYRSGKTIGAGVIMGWLTLVLALGAAYGTPEPITFMNQVIIPAPASSGSGAVISGLMAGIALIAAVLCLWMGYRQAAAHEAFKHGVAEAWLPCKASEVHLYDAPLPGEDPHEARHWPFTSLPRREENRMLPFESTMRKIARSANVTGWGSSVAITALALGIILGFWAPLPKIGEAERGGGTTSSSPATESAPAPTDTTAPAPAAPAAPTEAAPAPAPAPTEAAPAPAPAPTTP
jgi:hypothetical protein